MSACDHFTQNAWRPDLCSTCQRAKSEHDGVSGPRSWRRKSEPNPNNAITGVRISALASKFQTPDARNGHTRDAEIDRAKTLDRKTTRNREKVINTSRSTELLDSSVSSSSTSLSSTLSSAATSASAISSSTNHSTELRSETVHSHADRFHSKNTTILSAALPQSSSTPPPSSLSSVTTHVSAIAATYSEKTGPSSATTVRPKLTASVANSSNLGTAKTSVLASSSGKDSFTSPASASSSSLKAGSSSSSSSSSSLKAGSSVTSSSSSLKAGSSVTSSSLKAGSSVTSSSLKAGSSMTSSSLKAGSSVTSSSLKAGSSVTSSSLKAGSSVTSSSLKAGSSVTSSSLKAGSSVTSSSLKAGSSVTSVSSSAAVKSNRPQHPGNESTTKVSITQPSLKHQTTSSAPSSSSSFVKSQQTDITKESHSLTKKQPGWKQTKRVSIPDREPDVIGHDGGLDNLAPEEDVLSVADTDHICLSLTDEEKQFALLALGNTLWNSDTRNLQVEADVSKRSCREFEDLSVDELWDQDRFKSLVSCDPVKKKKDFGTFPQVNTSKLAKVSVGSLSFTSQGKKAYRGQEDNNKCVGQTNIDNGIIENSRDQASEEPKVSGDSVIKIPGSDPESSLSNGASGVEMGLARSTDPKEFALSHTRTGSLLKSCDGPDRKTLNVFENHVHDLRPDSINPSPDASLASSQLTMVGQNQDSAKFSQVGLQQGFTASSSDVCQEDCVNASLTDHNIQEEFQAVALLNEVLKGYAELNESSTDDFSLLDTKKGKKSSDFEARMASVAATLDLTKQQQRGKRQAPRPSVSPPPEPNVSEGVSPKKVVNQPDPVFKMVTVGKSIVNLPPQEDMPPQNSKPALVSYGLDDFGSLSESSDSTNSRITNGEGKSKKGITSFFRNILRRGKDSSESFDSANPDVQLSVKMDRKASTGTVASADLPDEDPISSSVDLKVGPKFSPQAKFLVIPPMSPAQTRSNSDGTLSDGAGDSDSECTIQSEADTITTSTPSSVVVLESPVKTSPPSQQKASKGLASPKMMLRKATAKMSPPASRHITTTQEKEQDVSASAAKLYPAPKPLVPPPAKPAVTSMSDTPSSATSVVATEVSDKEAVAAPNVVRRRPKSPKRAAPPVPPNRTSAGTGKASESWSVDASKEQESKLRKSTELSGGGTLPRSELRESTRRSLPVPPSPPGEKKDKSSVTAAGGGSPPGSPIKETLHSLPSSPSSPALSSFDFTNTEWSGGSTSTIDDELPKFSEKIELPTVATQGRKGILGKLGGNRKTKAPQPPSVKRAKSITQSSTLPRGDKKSKKINVADISGPVMVTDLTNSKVLENRRNTISLGDEPAFISLSSSAIHTASTNSSVSVDKSGLDEFDFPVLSPLGSLENLYESILPKPQGNLSNFYDPPTSPKVVCPNITSDGYLEPVPPLSASAAAAMAVTSSSSLSLLGTAATNVSSSSPTSSASSMTTNASVVKSPLVKCKVSSSRPDRATDVHANSMGSHGSGTTSSDSSGTNSTEHSGSSLPDCTQMSSWNPSDISVKGGCHSSVSSGLGASFVEPEMTEQRRLLLASQPIYEEIPNGDHESIDDDEDDDVCRRKDEMMWDSKMDMSSKSVDSASSLRRAVLPEISKNQIAQSWLQQQQSRVVATTSQVPSSLVSGMPSSLSSSTTSIGGVSSSPSHTLLKQNSASSSLPVSASLSMSSSQIMSSSLMTTSLTSSMLPPPPPPPDHLPILPPSASRSISKETVSSESDTQSVCSNDAHSTSSTWSRPRPAPRQKPRRPETGGCDQYVSMNKPNAQVSLNEDKLRDIFTKLTSITFHALQDIYVQFEKILSVDRLDIPNSKMLKWVDFDIYGQPLHASGRCVVYNAKLKANSCPCQVLILHSRPATEMCTSTHPSLLRPSAVFADTIPFSYLTPDFIKTSQLLQNSVYDSSQARCFIAVGTFDIVESLDSHLALLRETLAQDLNSYLNVILTATLQLLSAMSHCLDQGFSVTETDYDDVFLITRSDLRGKVVAFLPRQRSLDVPQGEAICNFLDRLLIGNMPDDGDDDDDDDDTNHYDDDEEDGVEKIISNPKKVVSKLRSLLGQRRVECLGQVRTAVEYLLWGPAQSELPLSPPAGLQSKPGSKIGARAHGGASKEQELYVWLEKERLLTVARLAGNVPGLGAGLSLEEFYTLKFLLKTSPGCLAESVRRLSSKYHEAYKIGTIQVLCLCHPERDSAAVILLRSRPNGYDNEEEEETTMRM